MSSDRELLELAAKAAGLHVIEEAQRRRDNLGCGHLGLWIRGNTCWNPLTDDGDAFRLAVKLRLYSRYHEALGQGIVNTISGGEYVANVEDFGGDECATTRRAIVMAAAAIAAGRSEG